MMVEKSTVKKRIVIILLLAVSAARAEPVPPYKPPFDVVLDNLHERIALRIDSTVDYFDRFFGDEILNDDTRSTHLTIRLGPRFDRRDGTTLETDFDLRLSIPRFRDHLQLIADSTLDVADPYRFGSYEDSVDSSRPDTGLRYIIKETDRLRLNTDAGVRLDNTPHAFLRTRARYTIPLDPYQLKLAQKVQYYTHDGFGTDTETELSRRYDDGILHRVRAVIEWREHEPGITPRISFSRYRSLDDRTSWRAALRAAWPETLEGGGKAAYTHDVTLRRLIHSNWLYFEITPGLQWLENYDSNWNPFLALTLEINFNADDLPAR